MKRNSTMLITLILGLFFSSQVMGQKKEKRPSPPAQINASVSGINVTFDYSQPSVKGREIWGDLVPYGKVWRTGANETTWVQLSEDVQINGKKLAKGKYAFFTIPGEDEWTLIFNTDIQWGTYSYSADKDVLRVTTKPVKSTDFNETFTIMLDDSGNVSLLWADLKVPFKISK